MIGGIARGTNRLNPLAIRAWIKSAAERKPHAKFSDGGGLYLTLTTAQTPVWRVKYRFDGKERLFAVGTYPEISLQDARTVRSEVKAQLAAGRDPVQTRQLGKVAAVASSGNTFASVRDEWLKRHQARWSKSHFKTTSDTLGRYARSLDGLPIADITDPMIGKLVEYVAVKGIAGNGSPDTARKLQGSLVGLFKYAMAKGFCAANPAFSASALILRPRLSGRQPALLDWAPLGDVLRRASAANLSRAVHMAHRLCAFTAARVGNVISAEWAEFAELDAEVPTWIIPRHKMKAQDRHHDHRVILGQGFAAELRVWRGLGAGRYLFPSLTDPNEHITSESLSKLYRITLGLKDKHVPHGWRAALNTLASESPEHFDRDAVNMALDHVHDTEVIRRYDRGERLPERTRLANWWCQQLTNAERGTL